MSDNKRTSKGEAAILSLDIFFAAFITAVFLGFLRYASFYITAGGLFIAAAYITCAVAFFVSRKNWPKISIVASWLQIALTSTLCVLTLFTARHVAVTFGRIGELSALIFIIVVLLLVEIFALFPITKLVFFHYKNPKKVETAKIV